MKGIANYGLHPAYQHNPMLERGEYEWTGARVRYSAAYQWHVYAWARYLMLQWNLQSVVDVGCGTAIKLHELLAPVARRVIGIDQRQAISYCRRSYGVGEYLVDDFEAPAVQLDFKPDLLLCVDVIEHVSNPDSLLDYVWRLAGHETFIILSTPNRDRLRGKGILHSPNPDHVREWNDMELAAYVAQAGFEIYEHRHFPPMRLRLNVLTLTHLIRQARPGRSWRYNQALLCRKGDRARADEAAPRSKGSA